MSFYAAALLPAWLLSTVPVAVDAGQVTAKVDVSEQAMRVYRDGTQLHKWPVSTVSKGKITLRGSWTAKFSVQEP